MATMTETDVPEWIVADALAGNVVVNIGQINEATKRFLDREVKKGRLVTWRGKWYPQAGCPFGIGPDKRCWSSRNPWEGCAPSYRALPVTEAA